MTTTQKLFASIILVAGLISAAPKQQNWWKDSAPVHQGTSAWHPFRQYSPDIERGLSILETVEPDEVSYIRSRGYPITFIPGIPGTMADTTPFGVIEIPYRFQNQPPQLAVVLSHEIVHEQRHDPITNPPVYPLWRRLLWHQEEEIAQYGSLGRLQTSPPVPISVESPWEGLVLGTVDLLVRRAVSSLGPKLPSAARL